MPFNINEIRSQLEFGGARPTLFEVNIFPNNPALLPGMTNLRFMCRASSIPSATLGVIEVPYFGRKVKVAGDRTFEDWQVTVINDEDFNIRNSMERWVSFVNSPEGNTTRTPRPIQYKGVAEVIQYAKSGKSLRSYSFDGIFPTQVSSIDLDWNANDMIEEFQVNFAYDFNYVVSGDTVGERPPIT